jgi:hypothetical protein
LLTDVWDKAIQNTTKYVRYKATIVLMLSWKDSDLNKPELDKEVKGYNNCSSKPGTNGSKVADLAEVFRDDYGFEVFQHVLDSKDNPRRRLNKYLSNFIDEYDKDETLLILYYAGHGWDAPNLSQRMHSTAQQEFMLAE